jgi:L-aspartate oxidase
LASNSLLEALVLSSRVAEITANNSKEIPDIPDEILKHPLSDKPLPDEFIVISHEWDVIRRVMTNYVGVVSSNKRLDIALNHLNHIYHIVEEFVKSHYPTIDAYETLNLVTIAQIITKSAMLRKESRGLHYNIDYPNRDDKNWKKNTILIKEQL